jgi:uncharacterized protein YhbP (UPF0306 family)
MDDEARRLIEASDYLTLATADQDGLPWATPVWFAHDPDLTRFFWVSKPRARHSVNIAERAETALSVFDSRSPIGQGQGVYVEATSRRLEGDEAAAGIATFSARSVERGGVAWSAEDVAADAALRLYEARVGRAWILDGFDQRVPA